MEKPTSTINKGTGPGAGVVQPARGGLAAGLAPCQGLAADLAGKALSSPQERQAEAVAVPLLPGETIDEILRALDAGTGARSRAVSPPSLALSWSRAALNCMRWRWRRSRTSPENSQRRGPVVAQALGEGTLLSLPDADSPGFATNIVASLRSTTITAGHVTSFSEGQLRSTGVTEKLLPCGNEVVGAASQPSERLSLALAPGGSPTPVRLLSAAQQGDRALVRTLPSEGKDTNARNERGEAAIHVAVKNGDWAATVELFDAGASVDCITTDERRWSLLHFSTFYGHEALSEMLIVAGEERLVRLKTNHGSTALHLAAQMGREGLARKLIAGGAEVDGTNLAGETPLLLACKRGCAGTARCLLNAGALPGFIIPGGSSRTLLHCAAENGHESVCEALLEHADPALLEAASSNGFTALLSAAWNGHAGTVSLLVAKGAIVSAMTENGWGALCLAARNGHKEAVNALLGAGVLPFSVTANVYGWSPLHLSSFYGHEEVSESLLKAARKERSVLLGLRSKDDGSTALHLAAQEGQVNVAQLLIACGARTSNIDATTVAGKTALTLACENDHEVMAKLLMANGASPSHINPCDSRRSTLLHLAVELGNEGVTRALLERDAALLETRDSRGCTALLVGVLSGRSAIVSLLVGSRAKLHVTTSDGWGALCLAARHGHKEVAEVLLRAGLKPSTVSSNDQCCSPLHVSSFHGRVDMTELLISAAGEDPAERKKLLDFKTKDTGSTALHIAAEQGKEAVVDQLIKAGADVHMQDLSGLTAFVLACRGGMESIVKLLLKARSSLWDTVSGDDRCRNVLHLAVELGHEGVSKELVKAGGQALLDARTSDGSTALHLAVKKGDAAMASFLLASGANLNSTTKSGWLPLSLAARYGQTDVARILVAKGAPVLAVTANAQEWSPLHVSSFLGYEEVSNLLITHGREELVRLQTKDAGSTALHLAAQEGKADIARLLLANGANVNTTNHRGCTPLYFACKNGREDVAKLLLDNDASPLVVPPRNDRRNLLHLAVQLGYHGIGEELIKRAGPALLEAKDSEGYTPLLLAARKGQARMVSSLIGKDATVTATTKSGLGALYLAARHGHVEAVGVLLHADVSPFTVTDDACGWSPLHVATVYGHEAVNELLIRAGGKMLLDLRTNDKRATALHLAVQQGKEAVARQLIKAGANVNAVDLTRLTPLVYACRDGREGIVRDLLAGDASLDCILPGDGSSTPLHYSVELGHVGVSKALAEAGKKALLEARTSDGSTALHVAVKKGGAAMVGALIGAMVAVDADLNARDKSGCAPIDIAANGGRVQVVEALLNAGASALGTTTDARRYSLLHHSAEAGNEQMSKLLVERKGQELVPMKTNGDAFTALHFSAINGNTASARLFLKNGADAHATDSIPRFGYTPAHYACAAGHMGIVDLLFDAEVSPLSLSSEACRWTLLHAAARSGQEAILEKLLQRGGKALINARARLGGYTALHLAAYGGFDGTVRLLLDSGADVNLRSASGHAAIHLAAAGGHPTVLKTLVAAGASPDCRRFHIYASTPLHDAAYKGQAAAVKLLLQEGADFLVGAVYEAIATPDDDQNGFLLHEVLTPRGVAERHGKETVLAVYKEIEELLSPGSSAPIGAEWRRLRWNKVATSEPLEMDDDKECEARKAQRLAPLKDDAWERRKILVAAYLEERIRRSGGRPHA